MRSRFLGYLLFILFFYNSSLAQDIKKDDIDIDNFIQTIFQQQDDNINYEDLYESLFQYYTSPLNLNTADREDLGSLFILSPLQINNFLKYRNENGQLISLYELQSIPTFDLETIRKLLPFVEIRQKESGNNLWRRIKNENNSYFLLKYERTLEAKKGNTNNSYAGSADKIYTRFRSNRSKDYSIGFTMEKDPGEKIIFDPKTKRYGADFLSYHAAIFNKGKFKALSIGDYQLQFGQGLILSSGFNIGKGSETINTVKRNNIGIRPYSSVLEAGYFRGIATTYKMGIFDITGFYSNKNVDAAIASDSIENSFSSIYVSGFHRTANEIASKQQINEQVYGGNISSIFLDKNLHIGATIVNTKYSTAQIKADKPYNIFEFTGTHNFVGGLDYSYIFRNFNFFGEAGMSENGGKGLVSGFVSSLSSRIDLSMVYRNYGKDFHSFYANSFGENTRTINEKGIYWGIKLRPWNQIMINAYYDHFKFPWLKYQTDAPSQGNEYLVKIIYQPSKAITLYGQYRNEQKEKNQRGNTTNLNYLTPAQKSNYLVNLDCKVNELLYMRSRVQYSTYQQGMPASKGYYAMHELGLNLKKISISSRFAIFDADDYDTRQYAYERDVLYSFSLPSFYGKGVRTYILLQFQLLRNLDIWVRYARTNYSNQETISSGLEEIQGPHKTDVKLQLRYKL